MRRDRKYNQRRAHARREEPGRKPQAPAEDRIAGLPPGRNEDYGRRRAHTRQASQDPMSTLFKGVMPRNVRRRMAEELF